MSQTVLVIGAGVAGMKASVELLQQGFKIILVERESSIGGKMAKIDRVFPTNEHTACAMQPLIMDLTKSRNATLLCSSEIVSLQGQLGEFTAEVSIHDSKSVEKPQKMKIDTAHRMTSLILFFLPS